MAFNGASNEQYFGGVTVDEGVFGNASNQFQTWTGSATGPTVAPALATDYVLTEIWSNPTQLRLDSGSFSSSAVAAVNPGGITIGSGVNGSAPANMRLYAVFMINRALTTQERANVVTWMGAKQGRVL